MKRAGVLCAAVLPLVLNACRGGSAVPSLPGAMLPASQPGAVHVPTTRIVVRGSFERRGPTFLARRNRLKTNAAANALTFDHLLVNGTLYPGDAAPYQIKTSVTMPVPANGKYAASLSFSNVPIHRNEFVILDFNGVAKDGSMVDVGDLLGVINVPSVSGKTPQLNISTSLTAQAYMLMLLNGEISTWDLDNTPTLAAQIHAAVAHTGIQPDPNTLLYNGGQLRKIFDAIALTFSRTLRVNMGTQGSVVLVQDWRNDEELDLQLNRFFIGGLASEPIPKIGSVWGADGNCGMFPALPLHAPPRTPLVAGSVRSCISPNATGKATLSNVYGGHLLLGAANTSFEFFAPSTPPYVGGFVALGGEPPGTRNVTVPTAPAEADFTTDDPAGFAFGARAEGNFRPLFTIATNFGTGPLAVTSFQPPNSVFGRISVPTAYSSTNNIVAVETFNVFDINPAHMQLCGGESCVPLTGKGSVFHVLRAFDDPGTNLTYFNWQAGGVATAIAQGTNHYDVTTSGPGDATLTTTTPAALIPNQPVDITANTPAGTPWTVEVTDQSGKTYTNSAFTQSVDATIVMSSIPHLIKAKSIKLTFSSPAAGTFSLFQVNCNVQGC